MHCVFACICVRSYVQGMVPTYDELARIASLPSSVDQQAALDDIAQILDVRSAVVAVVDDVQLHF